MNSLRACLGLVVDAKTSSWAAGPILRVDREMLGYRDGSRDVAKQLKINQGLEGIDLVEHSPFAHLGSILADKPPLLGYKYYAELVQNPAYRQSSGLPRDSRRRKEATSVHNDVEEEDAPPPSVFDGIVDPLGKDHVR